ncbi:HAMP domain-containing methyl-accepting chemotaxis protein [Clostridium tagluense]|uniref:HAMP domain-containing methyl-accepting chemotaxis protein n=1 Tax=Clostridium tagluense TaxID=360422 RepID=UPI001CF28D32|nr:methyl-accepting chemotaxis protein [Clostridium tagluense]MCB2298997.1 methyl-accepting chemotaxis protein [Clostridium tagluense]
MKWFYDFKISAKIVSGFLIIAFIAAFLGILGIKTVRSITNNSNALYNENTIGLSEIGMLQSDFLKINVNIRTMALLSKDKRTVCNDRINEYKISLKDNMEKVSQKLTPGEQTTNYNNVKASLDDYQKEIEKIAVLAMGNGTEEQLALLISDADIRGKTLSDLIQIIYNLNLKQAKQKAESNANTAAQNEFIMIAISAVAVLLAIVLAIIISNIISKPINKLLKAAKSISEGDTNVKLDINTKDEVGNLASAFEKIINALNNLVSDTNMLAQAAVEGNLEVRADVTKHCGNYELIVEGVNSTLDAITKPLNESRKILANMAVNDLTMTMTGSYKGMMKAFSEDINSVHARILEVVKVITEISVGDIGSLEALNKIGKRSENDQLVPSMIVMMTTIQKLVDEASMIADHAAKGNLQARSDATKLQGGYRDILEGFNKALDAVEAPIKEATEVLMEMADGNLCVAMEGNYTGSYQVIKDSLNHTVEAFNELLGNITEAADQVFSGSNQVSDGSQALSQGTTEQASSIEELTASITEVAAQTKQNAVNASQANELSLNAKEGAVIGNTHMKEMLKSMEEINESSSSISKIIKVIDDIAFQTNMLALNAAVEAARAGQHGKGFAVVAEEVRNLAARSAKAAKETTDLVEGSIKKVEIGTKIANNTAESLDQIVLGVSKAATLVGEIAAASNEQATAIYQINKGIEQVSDVVQTNSATAEQSAAASQELSSQAEMLKSMVGKFRLKRCITATYNEVPLGNQRNSNKVKSKFSAHDEAAATKNKPKISLSNMEFGKY